MAAGGGAGLAADAAVAVALQSSRDTATRLAALKSSAVDKGESVLPTPLTPLTMVRCSDGGSEAKRLWRAPTDMSCCSARKNGGTEVESKDQNGFRCQINVSKSMIRCGCANARGLAHLQIPWRVDLPGRAAIRWYFSKGVADSGRYYVGLV